ncbi:MULTISPECIES: SDR family oxidoreductase [unclassified Guyparkeria]|uniref:UDP-glucose 4-epimerase family protein n=1 Tax=unclassified Guyparkeria TaxID=2626246 RepID=UPI000733696C|nr:MULTISPECIES: SDR family oxidoreductase [unclassified Guyparkeria]KTG16291.1 hypothetical protein AUR63_05550 [Guyparkeria sp. XI15]OAE85142.1 hypothetical protein AWR35_05560 [Guyparkeria sp. WRN-7]
MHEETVLVTGASGFVGRALTERLVSLQGRRARAGVRMESRSVPAGAVPVVVDLQDASSDWSEALDDVTAVVHCAARVPGATNGDEAAYRQVNVDGTLRLAKAASDAGVRRFVFLSSVKVNGESSPVGKPFTPNDSPAPEDAYGRSKLEAETGLLELARETGMEVVIVRSPLVYGPGVGGNFEMMRRWAAKGIPLPLGAIRNRRSLVGLANLVDFLLTCLHHPAAVNRVWMVSDDDDVSTTELLQRLGQAVGRPARLIPVPAFLLRLIATLLGKRAVARRLCDSLQVDVIESRSRLGWRPAVTMADELSRMGPVR